MDWLSFNQVSVLRPIHLDWWGVGGGMCQVKQNMGMTWNLLWAGPMDGRLCLEGSVGIPSTDWVGQQ